MQSVLAEGEPGLIGALVDIEILSVGPNSLRGRIVSETGVKETPH
jgi:hypothetical protein